MATPQITIDESFGNISLFNLALNVAGIINNKKNVALYIINEKTGKKQEILTGTSGILGQVREITTMVGTNSAIIDAEIRQESKLTEQPLETGAVTSDYKIKMPTQVSVRIALPAVDYQDILAELQQYKDDAQMIYIETKQGSYKNMQITEIPCTLNVDNIDRVTFTIRFKEVLLAEPINNIATALFADQDTISTGNKLGLDMPFNLGRMI